MWTPYNNNQFFHQVQATTSSQEPGSHFNTQPDQKQTSSNNTSVDTGHSSLFVKEFTPSREHLLFLKKAMNSQLGKSARAESEDKKKPQQSAEKS